MPHRQIKIKYDPSIFRTNSTNFYRFMRYGIVIREWDLEQHEWVDLSTVDSKRAARIKRLNDIQERMYGFTPGFRP